MKILFFIDDLGSGGAQRQIVYLACLFKKAGHEVRLLRYGKQDFFMAKLEEIGIHVDTILCKNYFIRMVKIIQYIRRGWQDVIISFLETPNFLANFSSIGKVHWMTVTSERNAIESSFHGIKSKIYKWFEQYSDAIVCNSHNAKQLWNSYYPQYNKKMYVIYNCVEIPTTVFNQDYIIRKHGKTNFIIVASFQRSKNPNGVIEGLKLLSCEERDSLHIDWYGEKNVYDGGTKTFDDATEKIRNYNLTEVITLHGAINDILDKIRDADVLGLFSKYEGLPNAVCEGMALSKPIVMSKVSDYNILVDEKNGVLCEWDDPESIAQAFKRFIALSDKDLLKMGTCSRDKAEKFFKPESYLSNWLKIVTQK